MEVFRLAFSLVCWFDVSILYEKIKCCALLVIKKKARAVVGRWKSLLTYLVTPDLELRSRRGKGDRKTVKIIIHKLDGQNKMK